MLWVLPLWVMCSGAWAVGVGGIDFSNGIFNIFDGEGFVGVNGVTSATVCSPNGKMERFNNEIYMCVGGVWFNPSCGQTSGTCTVAGRVEKLGGVYCTCNGTNWLKWGSGDPSCGCETLTSYLSGTSTSVPTQPADGEIGDLFGVAVAVDGTTAAVSSMDGTDNPAIYIYTYSGTQWSQQQKIAFGSQTGSYFLTGLALSSNTLLAGSPDDAVYVYTRSGSTWTLTDTLLSPTYGDYDGFGFNPASPLGGFAIGAVPAMAISGTSAWVGNPQMVYDVGTSSYVGNGKGYVAVFGKSGPSWSLVTRISPSDGVNADGFGAAVAYSSGTLAVAALISGTTSPTWSTGAVYVFTGSGASWSQQAKIIPSDKYANDLFGSYGIALDGNTLAAGSFNFMASYYHYIYDPYCIAFGEPYCTLANLGGAGGNTAVYVYSRSGTTWSLQQKLTLSLSDPNFSGPISLAMKGDLLAVGGINTMGGIFASNSPTTHGTATYFTRSGSSWTPSPTYVTSVEGPASDGAGGVNSYFSSVAMDGCRGGLVMGTSGSSPTEIGSVYFFTPGKVAGTNPCSLPWGGTILHAASVNAYVSTTDTTCTAQSRTCNDTVLSGTYQYQNCTLYGCSLPWGGSISSSVSVTAYISTSDATCTPQTRTCTAGTLSGSGNYSSCTLNTSPCPLPWGGMISHTDSVTAYQYGIDTSCPSQSRTCSAGTLAGSYTNQSCTIVTDPCATDHVTAGTTCSDNTVYVGISPNGSKKMYATYCDAGQTKSGSSCTGTRSTHVWNNASGTTGVTNANNGASNTITLAGLGATYAAATYCDSLNLHGYTDWYLPARNELTVAILASANFAFSANYWTSTEASSANASRVSSLTGLSSNSAKTGSINVRCVRGVP